MFPPDFFNGTKDNSSVKSERNSNESVFTPENSNNKKENCLKSRRVTKVNSEIENNINLKIKVIDIQNELDEDKEILEMLESSKSKCKLII